MQQWVKYPRPNSSGLGTHPCQICGRDVDLVKGHTWWIAEGGVIHSSCWGKSAQQFIQAPTPVPMELYSNQAARYMITSAMALARP